MALLGNGEKVAEMAKLHGTTSSVELINPSDQYI
jgi:hypothetical protein